MDEEKTDTTENTDDEEKKEPDDTEPDDTETDDTETDDTETDDTETESDGGNGDDGGATLKKPYADYAYYVEEYGGSVIPEEEFLRSAKWATAFIDAITFGRIKCSEQVVDCVRDCVCAIAETGFDFFLGTVESSGGRGVKSESNDGYSVSYGDRLSDMESLSAECEGTARIYLANTGLLYRGIMKPMKAVRGCPPW